MEGRGRERLRTLEVPDWQEVVYVVVVGGGQSSVLVYSDPVELSDSSRHRERRVVSEFKTGC